MYDLFIVGIHYGGMLECGMLDINDDYDFKDKVCYSKNKLNDKKKFKTNVCLYSLI